MPIETVPIFALSGQAAGASEAKLAWASVQALWPSAASGLIVRPGGSVDGHRFGLGGRGSVAEGLGNGEAEVQPGGRVGLFGGETGREDRVEDLVLAAGDRWVFEWACEASLGWMLVGGDLEFGGERPDPMQVVG